MHLSTEEKQAIFEKYGQGKNDTGSPESQIALFSVRIKHLTEHLKDNHKDWLRLFAQALVQTQPAVFFLAHLFRTRQVTAALKEGAGGTSRGRRQAGALLSQGPLSSDSLG